MRSSQISSTNFNTYKVSRRSSNIGWLKTENGKQTTARHREGLFGEEIVDGKHRSVWKLEENTPVEIREHRRMLAIPLGLPLQYFSSRKELLRIFDDVAEEYVLFCGRGLLELISEQLFCISFEENSRRRIRAPRHQLEEHLNRRER